MNCFTLPDSKNKASPISSSSSWCLSSVGLTSSTFSVLPQSTWQSGCLCTILFYFGTLGWSIMPHHGMDIWQTQPITMEAGHLGGQPKLEALCLSALAHCCVLSRLLWGDGTSLWLRSKETTCQCRRHESFRFNPWKGKMPWRRKWQPTPIFLPEKIPWTEEPGRLQSMGPQRTGHNWVTKHVGWWRD